MGCKSLENILIPPSVNSIGYNAFWGCNHLKFIDLPNSVTNIDAYAFAECHSLTSIEIPNSIKEIKDIFVNCTNLTSIRIPNSVSTINNAFEGCNNIKYIYFEDGKEILNIKTSFKNAPIEEIYLGRNIDDLIRKSPFSENYGIKSFSIGKYVTNAACCPLYNCENLEEINSYNPVPPNISGFSTMQYVNLDVNIPIGSLSSYKENEIWGNFWNLKETLPANEVLAEEIILNIEETELNIGETLQLVATVLPEDSAEKTLTWNSSNENVVSVSEEGLVTAISAGEAIITATCGEVSAECVIIVLDDAGVESLLVNPDSNISVYSVEGVLIKKNCKAEDLKTIAKGIHIIVSGKDRYKIAI